MAGGFAGLDSNMPEKAAGFKLDLDKFKTDPLFIEYLGKYKDEIDYILSQNINIIDGMAAFDGRDFMERYKVNQESVYKKLDPNFEAEMPSGGSNIMHFQLIRCLAEYQALVKKYEEMTGQVLEINFDDVKEEKSDDLDSIDEHRETDPLLLDNDSDQQARLVGVNTLDGPEEQILKEITNVKKKYISNISMLMKTSTEVLDPSINTN